MLDAIFQNDITLIAVICIGFISLSILITWLFITPSNRPRIEEFDGVVGPFFGLPAVLFSLSTALLATSTWDNYSVTTRAIHNESQGILNIISLANSVPELKTTNLSAAAKAYTQSVIDDEWQSLSDNKSISPSTEAKFVVLRALIFKAANQLGNNAESKALLNAFNTINTARETRLAYASVDLHIIRWYAILFLGALVLTAVAFIHLAKPKVLMVTMTIATLTILTPICMIALTLSTPYSGMISISNAPYMQIIKN